MSFVKYIIKANLFTPIINKVYFNKRYNFPIR